ncbi:acyl-CoA thioester hydrolase [Mucilaginibacter frigoritolerans]|jgi:acyl-CoA thioester hydrolase|uniref:Acyl-CoA thioester hydrolase n=1 Tax=Mucilaginibacter frigoritolerans TaxID=652788 RepID=A0A562TS26_9SPHI|nr:acyl-CoA thioesterase [Mucilaginibacter frigoritolerans]TWI96233.1 acyl-CoA thioester hydrolase [Mucilaginibacter frigoritolerans]
MNIYYEGQVLWSQIDANQHLRHSAYADFAAQARLNMMQQLGLKPILLLEQKIGPVLFREELLYLREVALNDTIRMTCELSKARADGSRWSIRHEMYREDGVKAAIINVDGAWIDMVKRKLCLLPVDISELFMKAHKTADYIEEQPKS